MAKNNEDWEEVPLTHDDWQDTTSASPAAVAPPQEAPGYLESAGRGAAQGLTFGFADELQAGAESLLNDADYEKRVTEIRDQYKAAADENPITYYGADIASGFALPIGAIGGFATKGASTLGKIGRSAGSGAILGGLSGAGTSEAADMTGVAKDAAVGAGVGAVAGPVIEGSITGASNYLGKKTQDIGALKDIADFFKYGKKGVELTGPENLRKITAQGKDSVSNELIPQLEGALKLKNEMYAGGKADAMAQGKTVPVQHFEDLIAKAEAAGADPVQIEKMRRELGILGKKQEVPVTDPNEYGKLADEKIQGEMQKLREAAYNMQVKKAEKIGQQAYKEAEKANKEILKQHIAELKIKYPQTEEARIKQMAEQELQKHNLLKDPSQAAQTAREKVVKEAEEAFKGTSTIVEPVTGAQLSTAEIGPNQRIIEEMAGKETGGQVQNLSGRAGKQIEKSADRNAALAYVAAEKRNNDAIDKLATVYREKQISVSKQDLITQLQKEGKWLNPQEIAMKAKQEASGAQKPVYIDQKYNMDVDRNMLTAKSGDEELLSRILPKYEFSKQQYQKPELDIHDTEAFRNFISDMTGRDKGLDYRSLDQINAVGKEVRGKYNDMLGKTTADAALETDKQVRRSLAEMGVDSLVGDASIENKINLRDQLAKLMYKANTAKGANESVKIEEAFKGLKDIYKNNPEKLKEVEGAFAKVKDKMRQAYLSDITTGHNTFAIDPTSINWTMTAGGKIGMVANEAGLMINKIANAPVGKLLAQSKKFSEQGYKKYASAFEKMSSTEDINKRRALMYTLLQDPGFRAAMSADIMGDDNAGQ